MVSPQAKREAVTVLMTERNFGVARACGLLRISRALYRYQSRRPEPSGLRERIDELAALKRRYGYRRIHVLLRREGWRVVDGGQIIPRSDGVIFPTCDL